MLVGIPKVKTVLTRDPLYISDSILHDFVTMQPNVTFLKDAGIGSYIASNYIEKFFLD